MDADTGVGGYGVLVGVGGQGVGALEDAGVGTLVMKRFVPVCL